MEYHVEIQVTQTAEGMKPPLAVVLQFKVSNWMARYLLTQIDNNPTGVYGTLSQAERKRLWQWVTALEQGQMPDASTRDVVPPTTPASTAVPQESTARSSTRAAISSATASKRRPRKG